MDLIILNNARNGSVTGYSSIIFVRKQFNIWVSAGTIYPILTNLENNGLLTAINGQKSKEYTLTIKGIAYLNAMSQILNKVQKMVDTTQTIDRHS
ncbi:MAG: PadR family transcriptional regulator [Nitrososphaerota archaeon]|nr:PadR family transcriptional regulator [Nitrososphaerota archaeon]